MDSDGYKRDLKREISLREIQLDQKCKLRMERERERKRKEFKLKQVSLEEKYQEDLEKLDLKIFRQEYNYKTEFLDL